MLLPYPILTPVTHAACTRQFRENGCDDEEVEIETVNTVVSLRCPLTGSRIKTPARFSDVAKGLVCFDLEAFLSVAERTRKWQCPHRCVCLIRITVLSNDGHCH